MVMAKHKRMEVGRKGTRKKERRKGERDSVMFPGREREERIKSKEILPTFTVEKYGKGESKRETNQKERDNLQAKEEH